MNRGRKAIGLLLIVLSITALVTWEKWGKNRFLYDDVLVLKQNVAAGETVAADMLEEVKMDVRVEGWIRPEEKKQIAGRQTAFFVRKGLPLFPEYFRSQKIRPGEEEGTHILSIPAAWISSAPSSMRKGHQAFFYSHGKKLTSAYVYAVSEEEPAFEVAVTEQQAQLLAKTAQNGDAFVVTYE